MPSVGQKRPKAWTPILLSLAAVLWSLGPVLIGQQLAPTGYQLVGTSALNPTDAVVYESYIEQGRRGSWWMHDWFTSEITGPSIWQPLWLVVGRVVDWFSLSSPTAYAVMRAISAVIFVWTLWWVTSLLWERHQTRRLATGLIVFGGGLGWLWALITQPQALVTSAPDFWVGEMYPNLSLLTSPHFLLVSAGMLGALFGVEAHSRTGRVRHIVIAVVAGWVVFTLHPFHIITLVGIWTVLTMWRWMQRQPRRDFIQGWLAVVFSSAPILLLYAAQLSSDALTRARASQNIALTWAWPLTPIALGGWLVLALLSRRRDWRDQKFWQLLVVWAMVGTMAIWLPVSFQRRLSHGLIIPFIFLSVPVLERLMGAMHSKVLRRSSWILAIGVLCVSSLVAFGIAVNGYAQEIQVGNTYNFYLSPAQQQLYRHLRSDPNPDHVVLGSVTSSQFVPAFGHHRVFIGHTVETTSFSSKLKQLKMFYQTDAPEQSAFLDREHICWIIDGPRERAYGHLRSEEIPALQLVGTDPITKLYYRTSCAKSAVE